MWNIAQNTFRELARNRMLYLIVFFGVILIIFSLLLASLSLGQKDKIILDFGLAMIEMFGIVSVVFVGSQILFKEIEGKTIYLILSKPIKRSAFILGKFFGFGWLLGCITLVEGIILTFTLLYAQTPITHIFFFALLGIYLKLLILFAIILLFSTFISPLLAILVTLGVYIAGHSINMVIDIIVAKQGNPWLISGAKGMATILPNFEALNIKNFVSLPAGFNTSLPILTTNLHGVVYLVVILLLTVLIFERKRFEN